MFSAAQNLFKWIFQITQTTSTSCSFLCHTSLSGTFYRCAHVVVTADWMSTLMYYQPMQVCVYICAAATRTHVINGFGTSSLLQPSFAFSNKSMSITSERSASGLFSAEHFAVCSTSGSYINDTNVMNEIHYRTHKFSKNVHHTWGPQMTGTRYCLFNRCRFPTFLMRVHPTD